MAFLSINFEWIEQACADARNRLRTHSFSEFEDIQKTADYYCIKHQMLLEVISDGKHCFLLLNTCPIAAIDTKAEMGMAMYFDFPPMDEEVWNQWELLGASTIHFEVFREKDDVWMSQVKCEEGILNALTMKRSINLKTGETFLDVSTKRCSLPMAPTIQNLMDWVHVRAGKTDVSALLHGHG
jgi:hypothetical protein